MRLDKFLSDMGIFSRSESRKAVRAGRVLLNGQPAGSSDVSVDPEKDKVQVDGREVSYLRRLYILLNKPEGYVSATEDAREVTVLELIPEEYRHRLFPCGRLDKYTVGLMLLTDDGPLSHRLLSPKCHVCKEYAFRLEKDLSEEEKLLIEKGIRISGGYKTKPSRIQMSSAREGTIRIEEGKYHQVRLMFEAVKNKVVFLERISFGPLTLEDSGLQRGEWRFLNEQEILLLQEDNNEE